MKGLRPTLTEADLCLFRFLYCSAVAIALAVSLPTYAEMHRDFAYSPTPLFRAIAPEAPPLWMLLSLGAVLLVSLLTSALGLAARCSLVVATISYLAFFGIQLGFTKPVDTGYVHHVKNLGFFILAILSAAPGIDRFTIRRPRPSNRSIPAWPKVLVVFGLGAAYFGAGYIKLAKDPLWIDGDTVQAILLKQYLGLDLKLGLPVAEVHFACFALSLLVIAFELTFFVGAFIPRLRWLYVVGGVSMHLGFLLMVGANFLVYFCFSYLIFVEWRHLSRLVLRRMPQIPSDPPITPRYANAFATVFALAFFVTPILTRTEAWPLSDYRVFSGRSSPADVRVLRFRVNYGDDQGQWLERRWQKELDRIYGRRLASAIEIGDHARIEQLTRKAFARLPRELRQSVASFELIQRKIERSESPSPRWVPVDSRIISLNPSL